MGVKNMSIESIESIENTKSTKSTKSIITKELLEEVLGKNIIRIDPKVTEVNILNHSNIHYLVRYHSYNSWEVLNIDTFSRLCKEYSRAQGYELISCDKKCEAVHVRNINNVRTVNSDNMIFGINEVDTVIKATILVIDYIKQKGI